VCVCVCGMLALTVTLSVCPIRSPGPFWEYRKDDMLALEAFLPPVLLVAFGVKTTMSSVLCEQSPAVASTVVLF
jgi:hypothetical protein